VLVWEMPRQTWLLNVKGTAIEGTLTLADKTVVRRMTLKEGSVIRLALLAPPEFI